MNIIQMKLPSIIEQPDTPTEIKQVPSPLKHSNVITLLPEMNYQMKVQINKN